MPATAILEHISQDIHDKLETLVSIAQPSGITIAEVVRPTRIGLFTPKDMFLVLVEGDARRLREYDVPGNPPAIAWDQEYLIYCISRASDTDDEPLGTKLAALRSLVEETLMEDPYRSNLAIDTQIGDPFDLPPIDGAFGGVAVSIHVHYRVAENDTSVNRR